MPESEMASGAKRTLVEGTYQLSPPAIQFDKDGTLHAAWLEQRGDARSVKTMRVSQDLHQEAVQVNPKEAEPNALHQAPGLAVGQDGRIFVSWSTAKASDAPFASDLRLARSVDGGRTFEPPILVNDDKQPIGHGFESVLVDRQGGVNIAWLDNRHKSKSGAGAVFGGSHDGGKGVETNVAIDDMACPCCRPMLTQAPDGSIWVAWRKTFEGNVRDIVVARSIDQGRSFSAPIRVHEDKWVFPACPHRGPSIGFDGAGRLYVAWYTEGTDEHPQVFLSVSDDQGQTFATPVSLHASTTSLPDQLRMAVAPTGAVVAVWEELTGVRKRIVMRVSLDRGRTFGSLQTLSTGANAEFPTVAIHESGQVALSWNEHVWPNNRIVVLLERLSDHK
ncbi:sialidase family protein [Nitrospira japonica]|nr:sialidase family protein [Nitrospira japonica]